MKRWSVVFKTLANVNRLGIIKMLSATSQMTVGDIAHELKISITATSNHLIMMQKLDVLDALGTQGHVYYSINNKMPADFRRAIDLYI